MGAKGPRHCTTSATVRKTIPDRRDHRHRRRRLRVSRVPRGSHRTQRNRRLRRALRDLGRRYRDGVDGLGAHESLPRAPVVSTSSARMTDRIAAASGIDIEVLGSSDLLRRDSAGNRHRIMQADQIVYTRPIMSRPLGHATAAVLRRVGRVMGNAAGSGPDNDPFLRAERAESRDEGRTEGRIEARIEILREVLGDVFEDLLSAKSEQNLVNAEPELLPGEDNADGLVALLESWLREDPIEQRETLAHAQRQDLVIRTILLVPSASSEGTAPGGADAGQRPAHHRGNRACWHGCGPAARAP